MTAVDLITAGVVFARGARGRIVIQGPKGDDALLAVVRDEVSRRAAFVLTQRDTAAGYGRCECCGDEMRHYEAGDCLLCAYARQKALEEQKKEAA